MSTQATPFTAPNVDMVPYAIELFDNSTPPKAVALTASQKLSLVSQDGNAIVVPDSSDATGATGQIVAAAGFSGPVGGTATLTDSATTPPFVLSGTWSGTFTPNEPASIEVVFGTPAPASAPAGVTSAAKVSGGKS